MPEPGADASRHGKQVRAHIADRIAEAGGWIPFARYMELALYAPGLGYYVAGAPKLGESGDFVTAPGISPLFGETLAGQLAEVLQPVDGILELGAGSGRLAADVLLALQSMDRLPAHYLILEVSPELARRQRELLQRECPGLLARVGWIDALPTNFEGAILANEVLDALPVHLVHWQREGIFERGVSWSGSGFVWEDRLLAAGALRAAAQSLAVEPPYLSEISLAARALVTALAESLARGLLLFIDYGFGRAEYYHPQRGEGTLMCHYRHRAHPDPFFLPGLQDITAHVDFTGVAEAGIEAGLELLGYATQAHFLVNAGLLQRLEQRRSPNPGANNLSYVPAAGGVQKLLSPAEMGELFKVIALGRGIPAPSGFAASKLTRTL